MRSWREDDEATRREETLENGDNSKDAYDDALRKRKMTTRREEKEDEKEIEKNDETRLYGFSHSASKIFSRFLSLPKNYAVSKLKLPPTQFTYFLFPFGEKTKEEKAK